MRNIKILLAFVTFGFFIACGGGAPKTETAAETPATPDVKPSEPSSYDPTRGEGKFNADNVKVDATLNETFAAAGEKSAGVKCTSCHKLSEEKLVGPGWKGVTERRTSHWIMNFITNPDPMIDKDPALQAQLELCLVRMPNQSLVDEEARNILEFMRKNDGVK
ncbi:MAG TPA: c-type cytochrome [Saprospiraceae bacterium]|nr:c-type cytochrome [Saprospiraceae bacterium]